MEENMNYTEDQLVQMYQDGEWKSRSSGTL